MVWVRRLEWSERELGRGGKVRQVLSGERLHREPYRGKERPQKSRAHGSTRRISCVSGVGPSYPTVASITQGNRPQKEAAHTRGTQRGGKKRMSTFSGARGKGSSEPKQGCYARESAKSSKGGEIILKTRQALPTLA